ncbi:MAG: EscU/YscU/HrcU family type III secretion system export apparatus switch protein [Burkholderiaceae bacterium]|jgi:flagellar biosynthesis protein
MPESQKMPMAAALRYDKGQSAPRVTAKGRGAVAEEIIRRARESGVALHESAELAAMLMEVDLDQPIPPQLYRVVAELLAWIYRMEGVIDPTKVGAAQPSPIHRIAATEHG